MFKNAYQSGFLSILYSIGSKPLQIWDKSSTHWSDGSSEWPHQKINRSGYSIIGAGDHGDQRHHFICDLPGQQSRNLGY